MKLRTYLTSLALLLCTTYSAFAAQAANPPDLPYPFKIYIAPSRRYSDSTLIAQHKKISRRDKYVQRHYALAQKELKKLKTSREQLRAGEKARKQKMDAALASPEPKISEEVFSV